MLSKKTVAGIRLARRPTHLYVHTESAGSFRLRISRDRLPVIVDQILALASRARALNAATSPTRASDAVSRFRRVGGGDALGAMAGPCGAACDLVGTSLIDRGSSVYWYTPADWFVALYGSASLRFVFRYRAAVFEVVELILSAVALGLVGENKKEEHSPEAFNVALAFFWCGLQRCRGIETDNYVTHYYKYCVP